MSDSEFLERIEATLVAIESAVESSGAPIETTRADTILTLEFDDGSKIVINSQVAAHELWVAARSGGFHYRPDGDGWRDTRDASELFSVLSRLATLQAGEPVELRRA